MELVKKLNPFKRFNQASTSSLFDHHPDSGGGVRQGALQASVNQLHQRPQQSHGRESERKRTARAAATEKELLHLNQKIEKLLANIDDSSRGDEPFADDEECVVCLSAKATMRTLPCGHRVVCRKCFVKTIQTAVTERCLPLRCVVCRTKILKLKQLPPTKSKTSHTQQQQQQQQLQQHQQHHHQTGHQPSTAKTTQLRRAETSATAPRVQRLSGGAPGLGAHQPGRSLFSALGLCGRTAHHVQPSTSSGSSGPSTTVRSSRPMQPLLIYPTEATAAGAERSRGGSGASANVAVGWSVTDSSSAVVADDVVLPIVGMGSRRRAKYGPGGSAAVTAGAM